MNYRPSVQTITEIVKVNIIIPLAGNNGSYIVDSGKLFYRKVTFAKKEKVC